MQLFFVLQKICKKILFSIFVWLMLIQPVLATDYYVKNGGNDNLAGTSDATAWETLSKVNSVSFSPGDNIYFDRGDEWNNQQLVIPSSGTSGNKITFGAYGTGSLPIISGTDPERSTGSPYPSSQYEGLIRAVNKEYFTIENIAVNDSAGRGIQIYATTGRLNDVTIDDCTFDGAYRHAIWLRDIDTSVISDCDIDDAAHNGNAPAVGLFDLTYNTYTRNNMHDCNFEGIYWDGSTDCVAEYNIFKRILSWNVQILQGSTSNPTRRITFRYNLLAGDPGINNSGVVFNDGSDYSVEDIYVYGNYLSDFRYGIRFNTSSTPTFVGPARKIYVYNNTLVDNDNTLFFGSVGLGWEDIYLKNNIFAHYTASLSHCVGGGCTASGIEGGYNLWHGNLSTVPTSVDETSDIELAPLLAKTIGWRGSTTTTVGDFEIQTGSPAINAGDDTLGSVYNLRVDAGISTYTDDVNLVLEDGGFTIGADVYDGAATPEQPDPNPVISTASSTYSTLTIGSTNLNAGTITIGSGNETLTVEAQ